MILIWPLKDKLVQTSFLQQRPRWTGQRPVPVKPTLPWLVAGATPVKTFKPFALKRPTPFLFLQKRPLKFPDVFPVVKIINNPGQIIWPIAHKLFRSVMLQQRPRFTAYQMIPERPTLPWDDSDRPPQIFFGRVDLPPIALYTAPDNFALCALQLNPVLPNNKRLPAYSDPSVSRQPAVVHHLIPLPAKAYTITGITKDSAGAVLGSCNVFLFKTSTNEFVAATVSNASTGVYTFPVSAGFYYYTVSYKAGSPDVAGTTFNTLFGI